MANHDSAGMLNSEDSWHRLVEWTKDIDKNQSECIANSLRLCRLLSYRQIAFGSNSYYLAVMTRYLQLLCSINYKKKLERFIIKLQNLDEKDLEDQPKKYKQSIKALREIAEYIKSSDEAIRLDNFIGIQSKENVKIILAESARFITYSALRNKFDKDKHEYFPNIKEVMMEGVLDDNQEAEGLMFTYLSIGLRCTVNQYNFFGAIVKQTFSYEKNIGGYVFDLKGSDQGIKEINNQKKFVINILRRSNQYYLLQSIQEMEIEQWNIYENIYYTKKGIEEKRAITK